MTDFKKYLATQVTSEQQSISYRNVARALKVHVNAAKCMLFEFYDDQNKRKPGSIYATYLLAGTKKPENLGSKNGTSNGNHDDNDDEPMPPSSPPPFTSSMLQSSQNNDETPHMRISNVPVKTITLVREEDLEVVKQQFETISSIHIYSLSPGRIPDLVALTDIGRGLFADTFSKEDPLIHNKTYGVIQNPDVRRRKGKRPLISEAPAAKFHPVKNEPKRADKTATSAPAPTLKKEDSSRPSSQDSTSTKGSKTANLKRDASDLFKSFAKTKKPEPKAAEPVDTAMADADEEGESEDDALFLDTQTRKEGSKKRGSDAKREREDKAAKLRKMMDSDDDDDDEATALPKVEDAAGIAEKPATPATEKLNDEDREDDAVAWSDSDTERKAKAASPPDDDNKQAAPDAKPGRRRGKRQVMKKKTMKDEDGYLVTKEEMTWESFSEADDEQPARHKTKSVGSGGNMKKSAVGDLSQSQPTKMATGGGGAGKAAAGSKKGGGGNIMSFFGKK